MPTATRRTLSICSAAAIALLFGVTACSQQSTEPDEAEVWPPTTLSSRYTDVCDPVHIQRDRVIVDFWPRISSEQADSFATVHGLTFVERVPDGNSYEYLLTDITETSHEFALRVREEYAETVMWAETTAFNRAYFGSGVTYLYSGTVDVIYFRIPVDKIDSVNVVLTERFSLRPFPQDRKPDFMRSHEAHWNSFDPDVEVRYYVLNRATYGINQFDANCVGLLIYYTLEAENYLENNPLIVASTVVRFVRAEYPE